MHIRRSNFYLAVLLGLMLLPGLSAAQQRPNILLIMTDDQGIGDLGVNGHPVLKTPYIDKFARESTVLNQFIVNFNCSPTRASLLTGRDSYRTGVVGVTESDHLMKASEITLAQILAEEGYRTGIFGKWHLGDNYPMRPTDKGFQEALVHKGGGIGQAAGPAGNSYYDPILEHNNVSKKYKGYCDDIFSDAAIDFISEKSDKPFFAYLATNLPHFPLDVDRARADPYRKIGEHELNARTYGMIGNVDDNFGRLMKALDERGMEQNTIVIFMSDNGPRTKRSKNDLYPDRYVMNLRGTKTSVYENGIRVPFFIRWPGKFPGERKLDNLSAHIDILPTLLDAIGVKPAAKLKLDGISLMPLLSAKENTLPQREIFLQGHTGPDPVKYVHFTVRGQKYKLISPHDQPYGPIAPLTAAEQKKTIETLELYDIENDPSEITNLAKKYPQIVAELLAKYEKWFDQAMLDRGPDSPQKILMGTPFQELTQLSRFDWGGPGALRKSNKLGYWEVANEAGAYKISVTHQKSVPGTVLHVRYKGTELKKEVSAGSSETLVEGLNWTEGTGRLEIYLTSGGIDTAPLFVDVSRMK
jgi:arylsulfatase A